MDILAYASYVISKGTPKSGVLAGTLDLMVLKTLEAPGRWHGCGIARRIGQVSQDGLQLDEGTVYTSFMRLKEHRADFRGLGRVGEQPQGEVLLDHAEGPQTTG
jgi:hypothetical protein